MRNFGFSVEAQTRMAYYSVMKTKKLPLILAEKIVAQSQLFKVQQIKLEFHNGEQRDYERLLGHSGGAVLIVPMLDEHTMLLVREFGMGMGRYELGFPKGKIDPGETWREASARECSEEIGYRPSELHLLDCVSLSAGYMDHQTHLVLAKG
jgi:ADP-ribose diphosphatase